MAWSDTEKLLFRINKMEAPQENILRGLFAEEKTVEKCPLSDEILHFDE